MEMERRYNPMGTCMIRTCLRDTGQWLHSQSGLSRKDAIEIARSKTDKRVRTEVIDETTQEVIYG